jgi:hypothetical protein
MVRLAQIMTADVFTVAPDQHRGRGGRRHGEASLRPTTGAGEREH